jgi:hypothetical protein
MTGPLQELVVDCGYMGAILSMDMDEFVTPVV